VAPAVTAVPAKPQTAPAHSAEPAGPADPTPRPIPRRAMASQAMAPPWTPGALAATAATARLKTIRSRAVDKPIARERNATAKTGPLFRRPVTLAALSGQQETGANSVPMPCDVDSVAVGSLNETPLETL
jgi:hypothetical protein